MYMDALMKEVYDGIQESRWLINIRDNNFPTSLSMFMQLFVLDKSIIAYCTLEPSFSILIEHSIQAGSITMDIEVVKIDLYEPFQARQQNVFKELHKLRRNNNWSLIVEAFFI